jgi:hypothetical protein
MNKITIIGGGASGLAVGALLSKAGIKSAIIEKNPRVGKKLLSTGNGRCNLGNVNLFMDKYHGDVDSATRIFDNWRGAAAFFKSLGLICKADSQGRLYPYSNTAASVSDTLRFACTEAEFICDTECRELPGGTVIWACGNSDMSLLRQAGHTVIEPFPSLCPIITDPKLTRPLKGLRVHAKCTAIAGGKVLKEEIGEVQFNDGSLSGICIMNLSRLVRDYGNSLTVSLDIAPDFTAEQLREIPLSGLFHSRIVQVIGKKPAETVKAWNFPVTGVAPQSKSQVMSGGIPADELNDDLSSKKRAGLYVIGEAVNIDGDCGGFNLEWCWASASVVARACNLSTCNL